MKLIGKLADNVSKAKDTEEAKGIIRDAGMELTDEEMEQVSGGAGVTGVKYKCRNNHAYNSVTARRYGYVCPLCKEKLEA